MTRRKETVRPWTWQAIAKMRGGEQRAFVRMYKVRGRVALVAASHLHGGDRRICTDWACATCPLQAAIREHPHLTCYEAAMGVYTRLIEEFGREAEE